MIYRINKKHGEREFSPKDDKQTIVPVNYEDAIVKKPWGYEYLVFKNSHVAIWLLHIIRKRQTSLHCHPRKKTGLVLLSGKATFHHLGGSINLIPLDSVMIDAGVFHSTEASSSLPIIPQSEDGILVMEIESPPLKTDLVRVKDEYGRAGASYEGLDNIVFDPQECLKFRLPKNNEIIRKRFLDYVFTVKRGGFDKLKDYPKPDALISIIGKDNLSDPDNPHLRIGELMKFKGFYRKVKDKELRKLTFLTIEKSEKLVKLSDFIFSSIADLGIKHVFAVCGGTAMHLVNSLGENKRLEYIATHHEQAAAMAAEGYARFSGKPGVVLVSSGAGSTNTITGVCGAWVDSIPVIFISGQVTTDTLSRNTGLRQFGIEETDIVNLVKPITKYAVTVTDAASIRYHLEKALYLATHGRPGPVWLDIPLDMQSKLINPHELKPFNPAEAVGETNGHLLKAKTAECIRLLKKAKRPVLISGNGIRLAKGEKEFIRLVRKLKIPVISSWISSDLIATDNEFYIGRSGIMGDRAGNFTVQNADLLLIIGSRMSIPQVGYDYSTFAREAKKIVVDIDQAELRKPSLKPDLAINADAREFMVEILRQLKKESLHASSWLGICKSWKIKYPVCLAEYRKITQEVNSFYFIEVLSKKLRRGAVIVTDTGTSIISTMQAFKIKSGQRLFTSSGHSSMGFGLSGAIGACLANNRRKTVCISGDGGLQMNIQELQTVFHNKLPIILFVLNNGGYLSIKLMQQNHFGKYVGSERNSGLSFPDFIKLAGSYGIGALRISNHKELEAEIDSILAKPGPFVCEIMMLQDQQLIPRVSSLKKPDGTIVAKPLEDLYPFLSREEFLENMLVQPVEILKKQL